MAESICRTLRDGALEGELAPALTIKDTGASPFGFDMFGHVLSQLSSFILAQKSHSVGLVIIAYKRSPSFYADFLRLRGVDVASAHKWIQILDCYTDPLGWKNKLVEPGKAIDISYEASGTACLCKDVKDLDNLYTMIFELGKGFVGQGKGRFSVAIDSVSEMLRHSSISRVAGLLSNLRSHDQISCIYWLLHSDLHEVRVTSVLEYMSSMVASIESLNRSTDGMRRDLENILQLQQSFGKGRLNVRFKRRNGRVRVMCQEFHMEQSAMNFTSVSSEDGIINQSLLPKFSLQLSEKEQTERANVVLPFEHQGNGKPIEIYDGRRSTAENKHEETFASSGNLQRNDGSSGGEIIYFRDSDDEKPDSDEDPDDDLDI
ncbi:elongator complex protein 5 isoform X2 [Mercurialis annua]|uniref:elongator complex protein 5 isoform X2 n=1 Tax=Mercurialis annua TaxID=3986 RepID=UPI00216011F2|nr:elongator complex protein 5 isoform X2 [Mercurialis annua]